ncbi:carbohydrate ABC transporter permease [Devosia sp.]|uniref:carbohydrate ABC transporter permease n=1 Tax=Devosia sp. TaxID=1871048 RepID=UPI003A93E2FF
MSAKRRLTIVGSRPEISIGQWVTIILVALFILVPFYTTALGGFKSIGELRTSPFGLPQSWDPTNFTDILAQGAFFQFLWNSLVIAFFTVILTLLTSAMAAFALSHIRFFGRSMLTSLFMLGLLFPFATAILPLFITIRDMGLLDNPMAVILPQVAFNLAFSMLLFRSFFQELPTELIEAARMDRCGYLRIFWHIVLPLSLPIIATVGVFAFVTSWNNFLLPLIMLNNDAAFPWPLGIMQYQGQYSTDWPRILAFLTLTIIPALLFFLLAQRYIISGLTGGAVKG